MQTDNLSKFTRFHFLLEKENKGTTELETNDGTKCQEEGSLKTEDKPAPEKCLHLHRKGPVLDSVTDLWGVTVTQGNGILCSPKLLPKQPEFLIFLSEIHFSSLFL